MLPSRIPKPDMDSEPLSWGGSLVIDLGRWGSPVGGPLVESDGGRWGSDWGRWGGIARHY